jgi:hypothetical protein
MKEIIKNITYIVSGTIGLVFLILMYIKKLKDKRIKYDGIERLSSEMERLKHEKRSEQIKAVKERSNILFSKFLEIFCNGMNVNEDSKEAGAYDALILNNIRIKTDDMMIEVIDINNITSREGDDWEKYKEVKFKYILTEIIKYIKLIWREDIIGFQHDIVVEKCRDEIVKVYYMHIQGMFNEIKTIGIVYKDKIKKHKILLNEMKNKNIKGKIIYAN